METLVVVVNEKTTTGGNLEAPTETVDTTILGED